VSLLSPVCRQGRLAFVDMEKIIINSYGESFTKFKSEGGLWYGRVMGGIAWPWEDKPGYAVILAEEYSPDRHRDWRMIDMIWEAEDDSLPDLLRKCRDAGKTNHVAYWWGDTTRASMMDMFNHLNRDWKKERIFLSPARQIESKDCGRYYLETAKDALKAEKTTLMILPGSILGGELKDMGFETVEKDIRQNPPLAALGYVLTYLKSTPIPTPYRRKQKGKTTWMSA